MPRVPTYNGPQVQEQAAPNLRVSVDAPIEAFGGGAGLNAVNQAASGVAKQVRDFATEQYDLANKTRLNEERTEFNKWENANLYGEKGLLRRQGKNAFSAPEEAEKSWKDFVAEREKGLSNEDQRLAFKELSAARWDAMSKRLTEHVAQQSQAYEKDVYDSSLETSKERGSVDPRYAPQEAAYIRQQVALRAQSLGWDDARTEQEMRTHVSDLGARVVSQLVTAQQDQQAEKFFAAFKDQMDPDVARKVQEVLEESSVRGFAQKKADEFAKTGDLGAALAQAREIEDPKRRQETEREVRQRFSDIKAAQEYRENQRFTQAANIAEQTKDRPNAVIWNELSLSQRNSIDARIKQLREGIPPQTDWQRYYELRTMLTNPVTGPQMSKYNLMQDRHRLDDAKFSELIQLQNAVVKGDEKSQALLNDFRSDDSVVNDAIRAAGINPSPKKGTGDSEKVLAIRQRVAEEQVALQAKTGKKATNEDIQRIVDNTVAKVRVPGVFWDSTKSAFELKPNEEFTVEVSDVPRGERQRIEESLRRAGLAVTDKAVTDLYRRKIQGARR